MKKFIHLIYLSGWIVLVIGMLLISLVQYQTITIFKKLKTRLLAKPNIIKTKAPIRRYTIIHSAT